MTIRTKTHGKDCSSKMKEPFFSNFKRYEKDISVYSEPPSYEIDSNSSGELKVDFLNQQDQVRVPVVYTGSTYSPNTLTFPYIYEQSSSPSHYKMNQYRRKGGDRGEYFDGGHVVCCHPVSDYMTPNIGIEAAPAMHMYSAPATRQSIAQGSPRCGSVVYYNQTPGYSCGPRVCAPSYVQPPQGVDINVGSTPPWIYPCPPPPPSPVTSTPPYPYQASHPPFVPSPSGFPIVCPPVVFYPMYPPQMSPRLPQEDAPSTGPPAHQRSFSSAYPSTTSSPRAINRVESMPEQTQPKNEVNKFRVSHDQKGTSRASHDLVLSSAMDPWSNSLSPDRALATNVSGEDLPPTDRPTTENITDNVLRAFKTNKGESFTLKDIQGHLFSFCLDQAGSRFLQEQLAPVGLEDLDAAHVELAPHTSTLMKDVFGNYIVQILLQKGSMTHRHALAQQIKDNTLELTLHVYGCRVVQKALEVLTYQEKCEIMGNLERHIARCVKDMNGNHVVQKAIREMNLEDIPFVLDAVHERGLSFAVHPYGCRVVQRILECECTAMEQFMTKENIMSKVVDNVEELSQDLYGNYVVQHVLRYSNSSTRRRAVESLMASPIDFACHKFASNVVEAAVLYCNPEDRLKIVHSIVYAADRGDRIDPLSLLTTNRYGNYVIQKLLDVVEEESKSLLLSSITNRMKILKRFKYGKHIVNRVEKMLESNTGEEKEETTTTATAT